MRAGSAGGPGMIFYFEAFDEQWKGTDDGWGLWDLARNARYTLCGTPAGPACKPDVYAGAGYYNPPPFSKLIAKACLKAWEAKEREIRQTTEVVHDLTGHYADTNLFAGVVKDSGRQVLINIERELIGPRST